MKWTKPDGTIEIESSGCCCAPGMRTPGQHTNASTSWARTNGFAWIKLRSTGTPLIYAECARTVEEFDRALSKWIRGVE